MSCPKCGRQVNADAVICPGCDFIIDSSFLGDDILDAPEIRAAREASVVMQNPLLSSAGYGQDDLILGDGLDDFEAFESENTGLAREVTHARIFVGGAASALLRPDAIPGLKKDVDPAELKLTPFEVHILSLCNAYRPVGRIRKKSGMSDAEVHTSLAMLHDKGVIEVVGHVTEARKARARARRRERRRNEKAAKVAAAEKQSSGRAFEVDPGPHVERTTVSRPPQAPVKEPAEAKDVAEARAPKPAADAPMVEMPSSIDALENAGEREDHFVPASTGDVDLDALAADAAAAASSDADPEALLKAAFGDDERPMSEQEILLSMAEGAVSEVERASLSDVDGDDDLDAVAEDALRANVDIRGAASFADAVGDDVDDAEGFGNDGFAGDGFVDDGFGDDGFVDDDQDADNADAFARSVEDPRDASERNPPGQRILEALADEFDDAAGEHPEPTGAVPAIDSSLDVGSIDIASIDVSSPPAASLDVFSEDPPPASALDVAPSEEMPSVELASMDVAFAAPDVEARKAPPPLPSSEKLPEGYSLEEDDDLADALMDSEEGFPVEISPDSAIRPAAKVAPAMTSLRSGRSTTASELDPISTRGVTSSPPAARLPGSGGVPPLPGAAAARPMSGIPALPGAGATSPPLDAGGISLEGFSLDASSEEEEQKPPVAAARPPAFAGRAPVAAAVAPPPSTSTAQVSFEMKRKARLIFEQAQKDMAEGRPSSALMNAKLACIYDPTEDEFRLSLDAWQNRSVGDAPRPKELLLFEDAKEAELAGDYDDAVALLRKALVINPRAAPIYNRLGVILATRLKQYAPASQALLQACELDPQNLAYKNNLGKILAMEEQEVDSKRKKRGLAERLLGGPEEANVRVRTIRPKQY